MPKKKEKKQDNLVSNIDYIANEIWKKLKEEEDRLCFGGPLSEEEMSKIRASHAQIFQNIQFLKRQAEKEAIKK